MAAIPKPLLQCVARHLVKYGGNAVGFGFAGNLVVDAWDAWVKERTKEVERRAELEALATHPMAAVRQTVAEVVTEVAGDQPTAVRQNLETYLNQIPAMVRRTLRRPSDTQGTTVPAHLPLRKASDLLPFLPPRPARFRPGDRPLAGVDWQLEELLGIGGFGEVWKAKNPFMANTPAVALKFCLDPEARAVLTHEAAMLDRVRALDQDPGIIRLHHTYLSADPPCLEYEFIAGGDLGGLIHEWHQAATPPTPEQAARVVYRLAATVGYAHRQGVVHRDLKPANVLVQHAPDGTPSFKIADFGIGGVAARRAIAETKGGQETPAQATAVRGAYTPLYASPQQVQGEPPDPRDDVFALGVIWYQLLTGNLTEGRPGGQAWADRLRQRGLSEPALGLLTACFEDDPGDRPADAGQLAERLTALLAPAPPRAAAPAPAVAAVEAPVTPPAKAIPWAAIAAAVVLLLGAGGFLWWRHQGATAPGTVVIALDLPGAEVRLDGTAVPAAGAPLTLPAAPGRHDLAVTRAGFKPFRQELTVEPGKDVQVAVALQPEVTPAELGDRAKVAVRVWQGQRYQQLDKALPVSPADEVEVRMDLAPGLYVSLFGVDERGKLALLAEYPPGAAVRGARYPQDDQQSWPLKGAPATVAFVALGRYTGPVRAADLPPLRNAGQPWPALPMGTYVELDRERVGAVEVVRSRDLPKPGARVNPEGYVRTTLEEFRQAVRAQFPYVSGVAFAPSAPAP